MLLKTISKTKVSRDALDYMRTRLENRNYSITKRNFPIRYGKGCFVTKSFMELPIPKEISIEEIRKLYAFQIHESSHILYSSIDFDRCDKVIKENKLDMKFASGILNIIEDYRVNTLITVSHPGAGRLMHMIHNDITRKTTYKNPVEGLLAYVSGYETKFDLSKDDMEKMEKASKLIKPVIKSKDLTASLNVLPKVYDIFYERLTEKDIEALKEACEYDYYEYDEELDIGILPEKQVKKNIEKAIKEIEKLPETTKFGIPMETKKDSELSTDGKEISSKGKKGKPSKGRGESGIPGGSDDAEPGTSTSRYFKSSEDEKDLEKLCEDVKKINTKAISLKSKDFLELEKIKLEKMPLSHHMPETGDESSYSRYIIKYNKEINQLVREMKKLMIYGRRWSNGERTGKLNSKKAYRYITNGDTRIFKKKNEKDVGNVSVLLLVDCSGSMGRDDRIEHARRTSIILHETLSKLKIKHMIVGYSADEDGCGVDHVVLKTWNDNKTCYDLSTIRYRRENRDGDTIRTGIEYFKNIHTKKKLMIVISDGAPAATEYRGRAAIQDTINAQKEAKKKGIKLINIGAGKSYKMPEDYINKVKVDDFQQLPKTLLKVLRTELKN